MPNQPEERFPLLAKDHYQHLLESTHAIPWERDLNTWRFTYVGPQAVGLLGFSLSEWKKPGFWVKQLHPEDKNWVTDLCVQATETQQEHTIEYRMINAQGGTLWIRDHVAVIRNETGPIAVQGFMFDITEQKQAETVINSLASSRSIPDTDAFLRECVKNLAELYTAKFAFFGLLNPDRQSIATIAVWAGSDYAENFVYELEGTPCKDILDLSKALIPQNASAEYPDDEMLVQMGIESYYGAPLTSSEKEVIGIVSVMDTKPMQLTRWSAPILAVFATRMAVELERKFATENLNRMNASLENRIAQRTAQLTQAYEEMESFSYSVSHDLRAPLRAIDGFSQALWEDYGNTLDANAKHYLSRIRRSAQNMGELIDDLLKLSKIVRCELQRDSFSLGALIDKILIKHRAAAESSHVSFINRSTAVINADPRLMEVVLENLINNACKYSSTQKNPTVEFGSIKKGDRTVHYLQDNGVGFNMEYAHKLFLPFERLHHQSEFTGSGIGLATVKRIIERHGGKIWAESQVNHGATFYFTLDR